VLPEAPYHLGIVPLHTELVDRIEAGYLPQRLVGRVGQVEINVREVIEQERHRFPVAGLTVSAFFPITSAGGKDLEAANFGAAYAIPDMATVVAGYSQKLKEMYVSADIKALKGMTLKLGFKNDGVASVNYVYATFGSTSLVEGLDLGLDADLVLGTTTAYGVELLGEYSISERVNVGAKLYYDNGDAWVANNAFVAKPFVKVLFGDSDVIVAFKYNATKSTWSIPIDFEISY